MHSPFQAVIRQNVLTASTLSQLAWFLKSYLLRNGSQLLLCTAFCRRNYSHDSLGSFTEGKTFAYSINWDASSFTAAQQERNLFIAKENLKKILRSNTNESERISNESMEQIVSQALGTQNLSILEDKLEWCLDSQKYPSFDVLKALAQLSVESKNPKCVTFVRTVMKAGHPQRYIQNARLLLFSCAASWKSCNTPEALNSLQRLFKEFPSARPIGNYFFSRMVAEAVQCRGQGAISQLTRYAQNFVDHDQDYYPITLVWFYLYTSELYTDHQAADELLNKNENLKNHISSIVDHVALKLLKSGKIQDVLRLLELMLKLKLLDKYSSIQRQLFNYQYYRGNVPACTEIYKTSIVLNVPLTEEQQNNYIQLITKLDDKDFKKLVLLKPVQLKF